MLSIKNRYTGDVLLEVETLADADLTDADLTRADLTRANLTRANLTDANLTDANLTRANLTDADLTRANLTRADLDFACWPLWCGSLNVILDDRLKAQLVYHVISVCGADKFTPEQLAFANTFHRVGECPKLGHPAEL